MSLTPERNANPNIGKLLQVCSYIQDLLTSGDTTAPGQRRSCTGDHWLGLQLITTTCLHLIHQPQAPETDEASQPRTTGVPTGNIFPELQRV